MASENPTWGYTRIRGALSNLDLCGGPQALLGVLAAVLLPQQPAGPEWLIGQPGPVIGFGWIR